MSPRTLQERRRLRRSFKARPNIYPANPIHFSELADLEHKPLSTPHGDRCLCAECHAMRLGVL